MYTLDEDEGDTEPQVQTRVMEISSFQSFALNHLKALSENERWFNIMFTSTGEVVSSKMTITFTSADEESQVMILDGTIAPVHKPLLTAGEITSKETDTILMAGGNQQRTRHLQLVCQCEGTQSCSL